ncbi:MAG: malate synthase A [Elusimicrobia bacterium RIFCSPLOWO2_01_FULL_60_11]|nr:MAG: malate synthase A [Elusimicrobia bacterium RIFCSPLOWO2_01_FULL_60_11]
MSELKITAPVPADFAAILTPDALKFFERIEFKFSARRLELLKARDERQVRLDSGEMPDFLPSTKSVREGAWITAPIPNDLQDRRVEITGPSADAKMVINAFNSGASVYMTDFEDSQTPTWENTIRGQIYLKQAIHGTLGFKSPEGKSYALNPKTAVLMTRPRGWHLFEKHVTLNGRQVSGSLFDFSLFFFHNAKELLKKGSGPYFYLPKMESHLEARLWNDVFREAQDALGIPQGSIRATVLIETILAAFEMDEILYELRDHSAGLNCGRWDYIFSFIKKFGKNPAMILPDRAQVTMDKAFLKSYVELLIKTCHRRGAHAMGGMAAQIPIKNDAAANEEALSKVRADKDREVKAGHDGTWVAHPGLVGLAKEIFDAGMKTPNQIHIRREDVEISAKDMLAVHKGDITELGLRKNISIGIQYLETWLRGTGCVPLYNLMEDAATAEISRSQVWQWLRHGVRLKEGTAVTADLVKKIMSEETAKIKGARLELASKIFWDMMTAKDFKPFLTLDAYEHID